MHPQRKHLSGTTFIFLVLSILGISSSAQEPVSENPPQREVREVQGKIVVHFMGSDQPRWVVSALEQNTTGVLSKNPRLSILDFDEFLEASACSEGDRNCLVRAATEKGVDLLYFGTLKGHHLSYEVFETWTGSKMSHGRILVGPKTNLFRLNSDLFRAVKPFVEKGGLLDQKQYSSTKKTEVTSLPAAKSQTFQTIKNIFIPLAFVLLILPLGLKAFIERKKKTERTPIHAESFVFLGIAGMLLLVIFLWDWIPLGSAKILPDLDFSWMIPLVAGGFWATAVLVYFPILFVPVHGLERIQHWNLLTLIRAWIYTSILRCVIFLIVFSPFYWLMERIAHFTGIPYFTLLAFPTLVIAFWFWLLSIAETLSSALDDTYVEGSAGLENPWHFAIQKYFLGYVRRMGIEIDLQSLEKIYFLSGKKAGVLSYGGGWGSSRIVINEGLLELAMGPREQQEQIQQSLQGPSEWNHSFLGVISPELHPSRLSFLTKKRIKEKLVERLLVQHPEEVSSRWSIPSESEGFHYSEHSLLGYVLPSKQGETVPLISNDIRDFDVVEELLKDHYPQFATHPEDEEEFDDTDRTDKDFLFGILLREIGKLQRTQGLESTFFLSFERFSVQLPLFLKKISQRLFEKFEWMFSRYPALLIDSFVALHLGRNHLVQAIYYQKTSDESFLTTRASNAELYRISREILLVIQNEPPQPEDLQPFRATFRSRLVWLSQFFYTPIQETRKTPLKKIAAIIVGLGILSGALVLVRESTVYHPVYVQRISEQENSIKERQEIKKREQEYGERRK